MLKNLMMNKLLFWIEVSR